MKPSTTKNTRRWATMMFALVCTVFMVSCSDDENEIDPNARIPFLGTYEVKDHNSDEDQIFSFFLNVKESTKGPDKVDLKNFRYINNGLYATVKGNKLAISQVMQDSDERVEVTGQGTLNGDVLTYSYKIVLKKNGQTKVFENTAEAIRVE